MSTLLNTTFGHVFTRGLFRDLLTVGGFSILVVHAAIKIAVVASVFGESSDLDAGLIAFLLPSLLAASLLPKHTAQKALISAATPSA